MGLYVFVWVTSGWVDQGLAGPWPQWDMVTSPLWTLQPLPGMRGLDCPRGLPPSPAGMDTRMSQRCVGSLVLSGAVDGPVVLGPSLSASRLLGGVTAASHPHYHVHLWHSHTLTHTMRRLLVYVCSHFCVPGVVSLFWFSVSYGCSSWRHILFVSIRKPSDRFPFCFSSAISALSVHTKSFKEHILTSHSTTNKTALYFFTSIYEPPVGVTGLRVWDLCSRKCYSKQEGAQKAIFSLL